MQGDQQTVRAAEIAATLSLATDLAMGYPLEHGLEGTVFAVRLAERLGADAATRSQTYYASLLMHAGCTADSELSGDFFGGSLTNEMMPFIYGRPREAFAGFLRALPDPDRAAPVRALQTARRMPRAARRHGPHLTAVCEVAEMIAGRLGLPRPMRELFADMIERWDGKGPLRRSAGEEIPLALRIAHVARDAARQRLIGGDELAIRATGDHGGRGLDPAIAACFVANAGEILALDPDAPVWNEVLAGEPEPPRELAGEQIDRALAAIGDFADLISPYLSGHSGGVADLAAAAAERCRADPASLRRAAFVHDVGRVAVHPRIWQKPGALTTDEWEQVRLHPYQTERVLSRSPYLAALVPVAAAHHERLDGSGYHRGAGGAELALPARLLAAADAYHAMTEPRPHRQALSPERAAAELGEEARAGRLDPDAVGAVLEAAGQEVPHLERPAGLTEREAEVVAMLARGLQTKQVAHELGISAKTADHHVQNAYRKIGVSTRAAATLFAMEHGLVAWGELPIARPPAGA